MLFALLQLEERISPKTPVLFLPTDHVVRNEEVMTRALMSMVEWIMKEPQPVYLLGAYRRDHTTNWAILFPGTTPCKCQLVCMNSWKDRKYVKLAG